MSEKAIKTDAKKPLALTSDSYYVPGYEKVVQATSIDDAINKAKERKNDSKRN